MHASVVGKGVHAGHGFTFASGCVPHAAMNKGCELSGRIFGTCTKQIDQLSRSRCLLLQWERHNAPRPSARGNCAQHQIPVSHNSLPLDRCARRHTVLTMPSYVPISHIMIVWSAWQRWQQRSVSPNKLYVKLPRRCKLSFRSCIHYARLHHAPQKCKHKNL